MFVDHAVTSYLFSPYLWVEDNNKPCHPPSPELRIKYPLPQEICVTLNPQLLSGCTHSLESDLCSCWTSTKKRPWFSPKFSLIFFLFSPPPFHTPTNPSSLLISSTSTRTATSPPVVVVSSRVRDIWERLRDCGNDFGSSVNFDF